MRKRLSDEESENFATGLYELGRVAEWVAKEVGVSRQALANMLSETQGKSERNFWKCLVTDEQLIEWASKNRGGFGPGDELEALNLANELPSRVRKAFFTIGKRLKPKRGGKPRALNFFEALRTRREVKADLDRGFSRKAAYERAAQRWEKRGKKGLHWHTIRRTCEPGKREHNRQRKNIALMPLSTSPD